MNSFSSHGFSSNSTHPTLSQQSSDWSESQFLCYLYQLCKITKEIEKDNLKPKLISNQGYSIPNQLTYLYQQLKVLGGYTTYIREAELNPYLKVLINNEQWVNKSYFPSQTVDVINVRTRIQDDLYSNLAKLEESKYLKSITLQIRNQKNHFRKCLSQHKHLQCYFINFPMQFVQLENNLLTTSIDIVKKRQKIIKSYLKELHSSNELSNKLCDIYWRFYKNAQGQLYLQCILYIANPTHNDLRDFLSKTWIDFWEIESHALPHIPEIYSLICYEGNVREREKWKIILDNLHEPLKIFRFNTAETDYKWIKYIGNVLTK